MWIPGNLLQIDTYTVETYIAAWEPVHLDQCYERGLLCFHIVDSFAPDSSRGNFAGTLPGIVRPLLDWEILHEHGSASCKWRHRWDQTVR